MEESPFDNEKPRKVVSTTGFIILGMVLFVVLALAMIYIILGGEYGWTLFITLPFCIGLTLGFLVCRNLRLLGIFGISFLGIALLMGLLLVAGVEGAICVLMALGIVILPFFAGMFLGYAIWKSNLKSKSPLFAAFFLLNPLTWISDKYFAAPFESSVTTSMIMEAPAEDVWKALTTEVKYRESDNFFLRSGVTYPTFMRFEEKDGKPCLNCFLTNDTTVLLISELIENELMSFKPDVMPVTMKELSFYDHVDAPHLHDYFVVKKGSFRIRKISENRCEVIATTDYTYNIAPSFYWEAWTDGIADKIHENVLISLKEISEKE